MDVGVWRMLGGQGKEGSAQGGQGHQEESKGRGAPWVSLNHLTFSVRALASSVCTTVGSTVWERNPWVPLGGREIGKGE